MNLVKKISLGIVAGAMLGTSAFAGNPDRAGQAGATQLVINSWARSSGWGGANLAGISGVEAMSFNAAGVFTKNAMTDFSLARTKWLGDLGVNINSFGFTQRLGGAEGSNAIGVSISSFDFGNIATTSEDQPEGGLGTHSIQMLNIGFAFAHKFSDNITAGALIRTHSEGLSNAKASGVALDAGIQYVAGDHDRAKFGVSLRNIGPAMQYSGDGISSRGVLEGYDYSMTTNVRTSSFEMPSVLSIGASYDIISDTGFSNRLTVAGTFYSNAFRKDQFSIGLEYSMAKYLALRAGLVYEEGIFNSDNRTVAFSGPCAGVTLFTPFGKDKDKRFGIDYSFRAASTFGSTHSIGVRLLL